MPIFILLMLVLASCARLPPPDQGDVSGGICDRLQKNVFWDRHGSTQVLVDQIVASLSTCALSKDVALQLALLNNPAIQVAFEEVGLAHADLIQSTLLKNPYFALLIRIPREDFLTTDFDFQIFKHLVDILLLPERKRLGLIEFERVKKVITQTILEIAFEVEKTFYLLVKEQLHHDTLTDPEAQLRSEIALYDLRATLARLLGAPELFCVEIATALPPPRELPDLATLQSLALCNRFDFQALNLEIDKIVRLGATKKWWVYTDLQAGFALEREPEGSLIRGPAFAGEIPLFNWGQADRASLTALFHQKIALRRALKVRILTEIQGSYAQLDALTRLYTLNSDAEVLADYWLTLSDLTKAVGGTL